MQFTIYKLTCQVTGLSYIGQTRQKLSTRLSKHRTNHTNTRISRAIVKYGFENFSKEILATCSTEEEINKLEVKYINEFNTITPNGYNIHTGGQCGFKLTKEQREKRSEVGKKVCKKTRITVTYKSGISVSFFSIYEAADYLGTTPSSIHQAIKRSTRLYKDIIVLKSEEFETFKPTPRYNKFFSPTLIIDTIENKEYAVVRQKDVRVLGLSRDCVLRWCDTDFRCKNRYLFKKITFQDYLNHPNKIPPQ